MRRKIAAALCGIGLAASSLVFAAPAAHAVTCGHSFDSDTVNASTSPNFLIQSDVYWCDYGTYKRPGALRFFWANGDSTVRRLRLDLNDPSRGVTFYHGNGAVCIRYTYDWFNNVSRQLSAPACTEPVTMRVRQIADTVAWPDEAVRITDPF